MRFVALALILFSLPVFMGLLRHHPHRRAWAFGALGFCLFLGGTLRVDASIIGWPLWNGTSRGLELSPADTLAVALLLTRRPRGDWLPLWGVVGFYGFTLALSLIPASVPMATFFSCWQFARIVVLFAAVAGECDREDMRRGLLGGLCCGLLLQAGYVAQQKVGGAIQASGTMYHQNVLGMMTELALIPLLAALLAGDRRKLILAGVGAALIVIAGGGSRGAIGIAGGGAVLLVLLSLARGVTPAKMRVVGLGAIALVIAVPLGLGTLKDRFGDTSLLTQEEQRAAFERAARAMAADHVLGVGANLYVPTAHTKGYADRAGVAWNFANRSAPVHNAYLLARAETGWMGQIAFMLLLAVPLLRGLRLAFASRRAPGGEVALGSAIAVGVIAVHNNYEFAVFTYNVMALLFVNIALIAGQLRAARMAKRRPPAPAGRKAPLPPVPRFAPAGEQPR